jgi:hypothetical protein
LLLIGVIVAIYILRPSKFIIATLAPFVVNYYQLSDDWRYCGDLIISFAPQFLSRPSPLKSPIID